MTFRLSHHAVKRALEMGLDADFIREIVTFPETRRWNARRKAWNHTLHGICAPVVSDAEGLLVITFLPASEERWREEDKHRPISGRAFDPKRWRGDGRAVPGRANRDPD